MKKIELLAPAGDKDSLVAAINAGCDAVYLSGKKYGARAFASNFSDEEIVEAINYAHLYAVKVYVTVNTLIYEKEVDDFMDYIFFLHKNGVDAIIIQDLGMMDLIRQKYPNLEIHASTQMNIHSIESVKLLEKLNIKRAVLSRELSIDEIFNIKNNSNIELEVFVQGALCVSVSGQCLMSSLIGGRSGNRGTCAQCCRMKYDLIKQDKTVDSGYLLSTKDLFTLNNIDKLIDIGVTSLKIEGRMKRREYVYLAVSLYRKAIDSYIKNGHIDISDKDIYDLKKVFNRDFTKGFIFSEKNSNFINKTRPNHQGVEIGKVISVKNNYFNLLLSDDLNIKDGIRIVDCDIGFIVNEMYINNKKVKKAVAGDIVKIKHKINSLSRVFKTTDYEQLKSIREKINKNKKLPLDIFVTAHLNKPLIISLKYKEIVVTVESDYTIEKAKNYSIKKEDIKQKITKINDTVYYLNNLTIESDDDIFIPVFVINQLRRLAIKKLNLKRLKNYDIVVSDYQVCLRDYDRVCKKSVLIDQDTIPSNYDEVYSYKNNKLTTLKLDSFIINHPDINKRVLVSELGSINKYKNVVCDYNFNVVNSYTVAFLNSLGADKITLSYELDYNEIKDIISAYHKRYNKHPNLEVIATSYPCAMICKYRLNGDYIKDRFNNLFKIKIRNNYTYIYHYKEIKLNNDYYKIGVNWIRDNRDYEDINI